MMKTGQDVKNINGMDAAHLALKDCGVGLITGVPGYPINGLFTTLQKDGDMRAQWQANEKIAYEMAMGASVMGQRAAVVSKHVGINVLSDPLIISATHGLGAGIVVIAGDDVGAIFSHNEQDSRWYGKLAEIPVFDPSGPADIYDSIIHGIQLSERISAPVLVRLTDRAFKEKGTVPRKKVPNEHKKLSMSHWSYTMLGAHQRYLADGWSHALSEANNSSLNRAVKRGRMGIISSGHTSVDASKVAESMGLSHLSLCHVNPFPGAPVNDFILGLDAVLVCEEVSPFLEEQMGLPKIKGRLTGHLPRAGPLDEPSIREGVAQLEAPAVRRAVEPQTMMTRGYAIGHCNECPYDQIYRAIKSMGVPVAGDAGCSLIAANPPYNMLEVGVGLGSSVGSACGFPEKGIAMMGDFALLHTGLPALLNAKFNGYDVLAVIFANREAAMTGGQITPDVTGLLKDIFKEDCTLADAGSMTEGQVRSDLEKLMAAPGLKVYVVTSSCPIGHQYRKNVF
jgi:indolepyruvate ferredoxin oxidoreductase alpha subunit